MHWRSWQAHGVTDHADPAPGDEVTTKRSTERDRMPLAVEARIFELAKSGIYKVGMIAELVGYTRQCVHKKRQTDREFDRKLTQALAEGRQRVIDAMWESAKKTNQCSVMQRRLEVVHHDEMHPLDAAKVEALNRATDPAEMEKVAKLIGGAFRTLPVIIRPDVDTMPPPAGEAPQP